jgi:hypothetical protein
MLDLFGNWESGHQYTLVLIGAGKTVSKTFNSRNAANQAMYKLMGKHKLSLEKVYDDKHDKTYICNKGAEFHINRL